MFTGIISEVGTIVGIDPSRIRVAATVGASPGDSIAIDGCCLTVTGAATEGLSFDLSPETFARTIAGRYRIGSQVNIESSLRVGDKMGGHFVTGHVDCVGTVTGLGRGGEFAVLSIGGSDQGLIAEKGSVTVNGVSLTVSRWRREEKIFEVALIPTTLALTNLNGLSEGAQVNIEYDLIARYLREMIQHDK